MANEQFYRESQKKAEDGKIFDYPVVSLSTDTDKKRVILSVRPEILPKERSGMADKLSAYCYAHFMEKASAYVTVTALDKGIAMEGDILKSIEGLYKFGYISEATYKKICKDLDPNCMQSYCSIM